MPSALISPPILIKKFSIFNSFNLEETISTA